MSAASKKRAAKQTSQDGRREAAVAPSGETPQSAAAPSPFTPIANYGFLTNCHTGALVGPDGTVDWLCVPRFDFPSVFGALVDRGAGSFRCGPFGINVPSARIYEAGTNSLVTSWKTSTGWALVRDALTMPRRGKDTVTPHTRPPADGDADHALVRTTRCRDLSELVLEDLSGYNGARPVRVGNGGFGQTQNDVFGARARLGPAAQPASERLPRRLWPLVQSPARVRHRGGANPTRGSGRRAANGGTTSRPS